MQITVNHPDPHFRVFHLSPDHAIVHRGKAFPTEAECTELMETVSISVDGKTVTAPHWWWNSRAPFRKRPMQIVMQPAEMVAKGFMFPYAQGRVAVTANQPVSYKGPMDLAGLAAYQPTTGERDELGHISDPAADFMLGRGAGNMLAWADGGMSFPIFCCEDDGKNVDLNRRPRPQSYGPQQNWGQWMRTPGEDDRYNSIRPTPDIAHGPELWFVAGLATDDPICCDNMQKWGLFGFTEDIWNSNDENGWVLASGQQRFFFWALRDLLMAHRLTKHFESKGILPSTCYPSSYFEPLIDNQAKWMEKWIGDPSLSPFRMIGDRHSFAPWQTDYGNTVLGWAVLNGYTQFKRAYDWLFRSTCDRAVGENGYPPAFSAYYLKTLPPGAQDTPLGTPNPNRFKSWDEAIKSLMQTDPEHMSAAQYAALRIDPMNGGRTLEQNDKYYRRTMLAALYMRSYLAKTGVHPLGEYTRVAEGISNIETFLLNDGVPLDPRYAVSDSVEGVPETPTDPQPEEPENPPMSDFDATITEALELAKSNNERGDAVLGRVIALINKWVNGEETVSAATKEKLNQLLTELQGSKGDLDALESKLTEAETDQPS